MKKQTFKLLILAVIGFTSLISCEKDELTTFDEDKVIKNEKSNVTTPDEIEKNNSRFPGLHNVRRYYAGPPYTSYSYKLDGTTIGASFGAHQGPRFKLNTIDTRLPVPSGTRQLYLLHNKAKHDFMFTTNISERNTIMATGGWYDRSIGVYSNYYEDGPRPTRRREKVYIHMRPGNGLSKLYRFYDNAGQSIHLFTTNYQEGVSKGYKLEGVIGYVKI